MMRSSPVFSSMMRSFPVFNVLEIIVSSSEDVHLHPINVSYDDFKILNNDGDMNPVLLDNKELRKGVIGEAIVK